jgi:DNA-binding MarR family transcriptional regulator
MIEVLRLFNEVRLMHHRLAQFVEELHGPGISAPERAVLEYLRANGPAPVPRIARDRLVTRQHIQGIVDALLERQLVRTEPNPAHRRSSLIVLNDDGRRTIEEMQRREVRELRVLLSTSRATMGQIASAAEVLATLRHDLSRGDSYRRAGAPKTRARTDRTDSTDDMEDAL